MWNCEIIFGIPNKAIFIWHNFIHQGFVNWEFQMMVTLHAMAVGIGHLRQEFGIPCGSGICGQKCLHFFAGRRRHLGTTASLRPPHGREEPQGTLGNGQASGNPSTPTAWDAWHCSISSDGLNSLNHSDLSWFVLRFSEHFELNGSGMGNAGIFSMLGTSRHSHCVASKWTYLSPTVHAILRARAGEICFYMHIELW